MTQALPKWEITCNLHPSGVVNGVAFLIYNTSNHLVLQDGNTHALLLTDTEGTRLGLICCSFATGTSLP